MEPISARYRETIIKAIKHSRGQQTVTPDNVYQPGNTTIVPFINAIIDENLEPDSTIRSMENLIKLAELSASGKSCLLLLEHYSNFDLPVFIHLLRKAGPEGIRIADSIVAIAGIKLSATDPIVTTFAEAYSRLVIYPSRSVEALKQGMRDPKTLAEEMLKSNAINRATMKALGELKISGKLILVFPSGTRHRPWDPGTKRGVREIDSYLKSFDYMCLVSINGNILRINPEGEMHEDLICHDTVIIDTSAPLACTEFREAAKKDTGFGEDRKQAIVDALMKRLEEMHLSVEASLKS
ncbi:MAG: 1-acyl-sn-glycerol-3-phosphate acyltransferase [Spirochaetota bacterium]